MPLQTTRFNLKWLKSSDKNGDLLGSWCERGQDDYEAHCIWCNIYFKVSSGGISHLMQHALAARHQKASQNMKQQMKVFSSRITNKDSMSGAKYVAEGYLDDIGVIINEFMDKSSVSFLEFASIWKKHNFALVFMGRPDHTETCEFTNEIFKITSQFLSSPSFYQQVGALYLLYSLFRSQIAEPPVKIRIEFNQFRYIRSIHIESVRKKLKNLRYVIEYLLKKAFFFVANQTLKGPIVGCMQKVSKNYETVTNLRTNYKSDIIQYSISNNLVELRDLHLQYLEEKKKIHDQVKVSLNGSSEVYEKLVSELHSIVNPERAKGSDSLGVRRAKIKAQSFIRKTKDRFGGIEYDESESDQDAPDEPGIKKRAAVRRPRRVPKHERKVGRPSKKPKIEPPPEPKSDDDNIDISHLLPQQQDFYLPPIEYFGRKSRSKREPYYKLSPKRESADSDADDAS